jgi:hypothetical protein
VVNRLRLEDIDLEVPREPNEGYDAIQGHVTKYWVVLEAFQQLNSSHVRGENVQSGRTVAAVLEHF